MGSKVDVPATTDPTATDWQNFIAWVEKAQTGKINITFSNMDNTLEPKIQAGSIVEIAGSLYSFSAEEAATGWSTISNSTQAYMRLTASGDTVSAEWTTTAPVWRDDLQGWYETGTNKRYVLLCYKDSGGDYTEKYKYLKEYGNRYISGGENPQLESGGKLAGFYTGSTRDETDLPIGSIVISRTDGVTHPVRNATTSLYLSTTNEAYTTSAAFSAGAMEGTWRMRGLGGDPDTILVQRVS